MDATHGLNRTITALRRQRPRSRFARASACLMLAIIGLSWLFGNFFGAETFAVRRLQNLQRFLLELVPYPLQGRSFDWRIAANWLEKILADRGWDAMITTLAIAIAAIVLAGVGGAVFTFLAARTIATPEPFLPDQGDVSRMRRIVWRLLVAITRLVLIVLRAIPEYVWAFLLLAVMGISVWPIVLALALHNLGILAKLSAEIVENLPPAPMAALRGLGATRLQIAAAVIMPLALPRFLMFFFYRWETCVREATILGMLGYVSLGYWIQDARARNAYDEMFLLILLGAALIMIGDIISAIARKLIRDAV